MRNKGILCALGAGVCWGASLGAFARSMTAFGFSAMQIAAVRTTISAVFFLLFALLKDRSAFRVHPRDFWIFLCSGLVSVTAFCWCYFTATKYCSLAVAGILQYTAPVWVIVLSALVFRERVTKRKLIAMLLAVAGCVLVSGIIGGAGRVSAYGLITGLLAGVTFGTYTIFTRFAVARYRTMTINLYSFFVASISSLLLGGPAETVGKLCMPGVLPVAVIGGLLCAAAPYYLYTRAMDYLDNGMVSILATVEPVIAVLVSVLYYHEPIGASTVAGIALILAAVVLLAIHGGNTEKSSGERNASEHGVKTE
ncbi:MAG: DMT family transporter [Eubacteriales bacterium]|nr:DMT family transporter [Eubacteriales bacterium]